MTRVVAFLGPSLPAPDARSRHPDVEVQPPAVRGDVYRAARTGPDVIVLVDGLFESAPSVWHKEILWALDAGIRVIGASSMGALRAAECAAFGMEPIGEIAWAFVRGERTKDSDVALAHGTADEGWAPRSEPLVNVEATLQAAEAQGVISTREAATLGAAAARQFYAGRTWPSVVAGATPPINPGTAAALRAWLVDGRIDQKRADALAALAAAHAAAPPPRPKRLGFASTLFWSHVEGLTTDDAADGPLTAAQRLLDELRLDEALHQMISADARARELADRWREALGARQGPADTQAALDALRYRLGALEPGEVAQWRARESLDEPRFRALVRSEATTDWARARIAAGVPPAMLQALQSRGLSDALRRRADDKQRLLDRHGIDEDRVHRLGGHDEEIFTWWRRCRGGDVPANVERFLHDHGYDAPAPLLRALRRERVYQRLLEGGASPSGVPASPEPRPGAADGLSALRGPSREAPG
jgi:hypothetical protein